MTSNRRGLAAMIETEWRNLPVLVVGDVMLDQYVWGEVDRISPEAPVPVVRATLREDKPGGAANVAMNLSCLGARVHLIGFAGGDPEQQKLESLLSEAGIESKLVATPSAPTTTKLRILSGRQQVMRLDTEPVRAFCGDELATLVENALSILPQVAVVVLSDYAKGALTEDVCQTIIQHAIQQNKPVLVDPKQRSFARYRGATTICPNRKELSLATGVPAQNLDQLLKSAQRQLLDLGMEFLAVTLGEKGIAVVRGDTTVQVPAVVREVFDVSGAGDTVIAVLALALARGAEIVAAAELANLAAGIVVGRVGTVPIWREELLAAMNQEIPVPMDNKVLAFDQMMAQIAIWKYGAQRIVFTNGCFDILHIGHIRLLEEARRKGDRLIVGVNSDESVCRLKGPFRPIVCASERARVLAALSAVDGVVVFEEDTPLRLIQAIRPDVLVKGGDYTEEAVVGAPEVRSWGGRVELIPLIAGISTTRLISRSTTGGTAKPAAIFSA